jgi:hypothetical protein
MPVLANSTSLKGDFHNGSTNKVHNDLSWLALTVLGCPYRLRKFLSRARDCGHQRLCFLKSDLTNRYYWLVDVGLGPESEGLSRSSQLADEIGDSHRTRWDKSRVADLRGVNTKQLFSRNDFRIVDWDVSSTDRRTLILSRAAN